MSALLFKDCSVLQSVCTEFSSSSDNITVSRIKFPTLSLVLNSFREPVAIWFLRREANIGVEHVDRQPKDSQHINQRLITISPLNGVASIVTVIEAYKGQYVPITLLKNSTSH